MELKQFWHNEAEAMFQVIFPIAKETAELAMLNGMSQLEIITGLTFDVDFVNQAALDFAREYVFNLVSQISATSIALSQTIIVEWIGSGEPLSVLFEQLAPIFGEVRAQAIGITEITRIFAEGNIRAWEESEAVSGKLWMTAEDQLVCPICGGLNGEEAALRGEFEGGYYAPPSHPKCRCWIYPILKEHLRIYILNGGKRKSEGIGSAYKEAS